MPKCKKCGTEIEGRYKYCPPCADAVYEKWGQKDRFGRVAEARLKAAADASGNPKVWTAEECSQEELRRLVPSKQ